MTADKPTKHDDRQARQAAALRANLQRRKAQTRSRRMEAENEPGVAGKAMAEEPGFRETED